VRLTGSQTFNFTPPPPGTTNAQVTIDRTVNGGLNTLTLVDTLTIAIDRSVNGGASWVPASSITTPGSTIVTKGVTLASDQIAVGIDPEDTDFRVTTTASTPVRIAGTVVYTP
jgi:hypothetical protein